VELADRQQLRQLADAAVVVEVPVRDDQVVDRLQPGPLRRLVDALGVAAAGVAAVDEDRLAGGVTMSVAAPPSVSMK
jgi:hypothetical protein